MSREIVVGTIHHYDWVQVGGAIKHPEEGKMFDLSKDINEERGIDNKNVKVFPVSGYGNPDILRQMINMEQPDYYDLHRPEILDLVISYGTRDKTKHFLSFIITFGTIYHLHNTIKIIMKVVI